MIFKIKKILNGIVEEVNKDIKNLLMYEYVIKI
jgi:hypothetical protein